MKLVAFKRRLYRATNKLLVGYVSSWGTKAMTVQQVSYLTHIIFAFIEMRADGSLVVGLAPDPLNSDNVQQDPEKALYWINQLKNVMNKMTG